ncbi:MAG: hypothetical protein ACFFF9_10830 [Candidatus Thorarchaeota archaeon]
MEGKNIAEIPTPTAGYSAPSGERPLGVTILAVLEIIAGALGLFGAITLITIGAMIPWLGAFAVIFGVVVLFLALIDLIVGWGLWTLKSWAWMVALIVNIINLILNAVQFAWLGAIINLIIIIYLQQGDIKSRFR